jgi:hypothetical protein
MLQAPTITCHNKNFVDDFGGVEIGKNYLFHGALSSLWDMGLLKKKRLVVFAISSKNLQLSKKLNKIYL